MNDKKYYPKGQGPQEKKGYSLEPDTNIADVLKQFADADYEHQPGYFGSVETVPICERCPQGTDRVNAARAELTQAITGYVTESTANLEDTQPYSIH